jgi:hypothetical protein
MKGYTYSKRRKAFNFGTLLESIHICDAWMANPDSKGGKHPHLVRKLRRANKTTKKLNKINSN